MNVICPACNAVYRIDDRRIPKHRTATATCKQCGRKLTLTGAADRSPQVRPVTSSSPRLPAAISARERTGSTAGRRPDDSKATAAFSSRQALGFGWRALKQDPVLVIVGMFIIPLCIQMVFEVFNALVPEEMWPVSLVLAVVAFILEMAVTLGIAGICLKICDGQPAGLKDLHAHIPQTMTYLVSTILFSLVCIGGFILLIVPGILLGLWLQFYGFVIVDEKLGPIAALKKSYMVARGQLWRIFVFSFILFLYNLLGLMLCGMGLLITVPVSFIAWAYLYRSLQGRNPQPQ